MACGRACGVKARERRVWTPYRGRCGLGGARGLRSQSKTFASGAVTRVAREVLTICSRARIVEVSLLVDVAAGALSDYWVVGARGWRERIRWRLVSGDRGIC